MTTFESLRIQYAANAVEMTDMLNNRRYPKRVLQQLTECRDRARRLSTASDEELTAHLANCRTRVSSELARMMAPKPYREFIGEIYSVQTDPDPKERS